MAIATVGTNAQSTETISTWKKMPVRLGFGLLVLCVGGAAGRPATAPRSRSWRGISTKGVATTGTGDISVKFPGEEAVQFGKYVGPNDWRKE
ncbi:hypothetical protein TRAPUB_13106 [Trametes pubescens]|uniref:Uncharacterized protein n=1 Tax=Trametes pubescens TaxID=154538 RepID=A0A1M2VRY7_TRAPU|nr:hypothetical protein TRAPUB_13106 [Trametes pubescens]